MTEKNLLKNLLLLKAHKIKMQSPPRIKRMSNFPFTPSKRQKTNSNTTIIYRGSKPEIKNRAQGIIHVTPTTYSNTPFCQIGTGGSRLNRIGAKIKVLRLTGMVRSDTDKSLRLTLYSPKDPSVFLSDGQDTAIIDEQIWVLKDWWVHPGSEVCNRGHFFNYKFPNGCHTFYKSDTSNDYARNPFYLRIQSVGADTVTGYCKAYWTDA